MTELEHYVERYETRNRSRVVMAVVAGVIGVLLMALGLISMALLELSSTTTVPLIPGVMIGFGIGLVLLGITLAVQAIRRRGEAFTLYENGFLHEWGKTTTVVRWNDVATVTTLAKDNPLARLFKGDVGGVMKLTDGRKVLINGYTEGAALLWLRVVEATGHPEQAPGGNNVR